MDLKTDNFNSTALLSPEVVCEEQVGSFYANDNYENKEQVGKTISLNKKTTGRPSLEETVHIEDRLILNDDYLLYSMADGLSLTKRNQGRGTEKLRDYAVQVDRECGSQHESTLNDQHDKAKAGHGSMSQNDSYPLAGRWSEHKPAVQRETVICSGERKPFQEKSSRDTFDRSRDDNLQVAERYTDRHHGFARELDQIFNSSKDSHDTLTSAQSLRYKQTLARGIDQNRSETDDEVFRSRKADYAPDQRHRRDEEFSHYDLKTGRESLVSSPYRASSPMHISSNERPIAEAKFQKQTIEDIIRGKSKERPAGNMHIQIEERRVTVNVSPPENDYKCFTRTDMSHSPAQQAPFLPTNLLRMPSPQMSCYPPFLQAQNQGDNSSRMKSKPDQIFPPQAYPFGLDPRFYDPSQYPQLSSSLGKSHQFQESLSVDVSPSGQNRSTSLHNSDGHAYQRQQQLLQIPRPMALGPNFVPHPVHLQGATPSSEEGNNSSPAGSSPFTDFGGVSPKSDDANRIPGRGKTKQKLENANQCSQCLKTFSSSSALAKHKLIHSDERKYVCQICSKGFKRQDHLNGHMITHRDKKPYQCHLPDCDKSYCDMRSLRRHLENHHAVCTAASATSVSPHSLSTQAAGSSTVTAKTVYPDTVESNGHKDRNKLVMDDMLLDHHVTSRYPEDRRGDYRRGNSDDIDIRTASPRELRGGHPTTAMADDHTADHQETMFTKKSEENVSVSNKEDHSRFSQTEISEKHDWRGIDSEKQAPLLKRVGSSPSHSWTASQPYFVQSQSPFMNQPVPWTSSAHNPQNLKSYGQNGMPFLMGLHHSRFHQPVSFTGEQSGHTMVESSAGKNPQENGDCRHSASHSNLHPTALQMFNHTLAGQQNGLQSEMYVHPGGMPYFTGHPSLGRPTNPTAIAVAAAKDNTLYSMFQGRDGFYGAHPTVAQWQPVVQDDSVTYEREPVREVFGTIKKEEASPERPPVLHSATKDCHEPCEKQESGGDSNTCQEDTSKPRSSPNLGKQEPPSPKMATLEVSVDNSKAGSPCNAAVSPGRKQRPHPGPIVIPTAVNNKVSHSVTFSKPASAKPLSPIRTGGLHGFSNTPPFYTPPPMLSPRSIFFAGACTTPRSGQMPSTPSRLLLSARRFSSTTDVKEEDAEQVFPDPKINVGSQFQASVQSDILPREETERDVHKATLMWAPLKEEKYKEKEIENFFEMAASLSLYGGADNKEYAAHLLHKTRGNVKDAVRLLLSRRHVLRADDPNADYHYTGATRWTAKERLAFRQAFRSKGKDFYQIAQEIGSKSVKQCVEFYYLWKAVHPEGFRARTRYVEQESEQNSYDGQSTRSTNRTVPKESCQNYKERRKEEEEAQTPGVFLPTLTPIKEAAFECNYPECRARFVSRQALNGHIRVHGGSLTKPFESRKPRPKPTDLFGVGNQRGSGSVVAKKAKSLDRPTHTQLQGFKESDGTPLQFACKVCGRVFSKVKSRSAHMKTHVKKPDDKDKHKVVSLVVHA